MNIFPERALLLTSDDSSANIVGLGYMPSNRKRTTKGRFVAVLDNEYSNELYKNTPLTVVVHSLASRRADIVSMRPVEVCSSYTYGYGRLQPRVDPGQIHFPDLPFPNGGWFLPLVHGDCFKGTEFHMFMRKLMELYENGVPKHATKYYPRVEGGKLGIGLNLMALV